MNEKLSEALNIAFKYALGFGFVAALVILAGENLLASTPLVWLTRLLGVGILYYGLTAWTRPLKPAILPGEDDEWYYLLGWDGRRIGFISAGTHRINPLQSTEYWRRITPVIAKIETTVHNKQLDTFDVYVKVLFDIRPWAVETTKGIRFLSENYPDGLVTMATGILEDIILQTMRRVDGFSVAIEHQTEAEMAAAIMSRFEAWEANGVFVNADSLLVDIMVTQDLLQKRIEARAELSVLQIIRDVAHDMGISTDELLIQRTLERLPEARTRQNLSEIADVLKLLRDMPEKSPAKSTDGFEMDIRVEPNQAEHAQLPVETPSTYIEGSYEYVDEYDPDADDDQPRDIYSPFQ